MIGNLTLEITRKCNMNCAHCLRGETQNKNMTDRTIDRIFEILRYEEHSIGILSITGGEPTMNMHAILRIYQNLRIRKISLDTFYMVVNGLHIPKTFFNLIKKYISFCNVPEGCGVLCSKDYYHDNIPEENRNKLQQFAEENGINYYDKTCTDTTVLSMGNGVGWNNDYVEINRYSLFDDDINEGNLYVSCNGNVYPSCDLSYDVMKNNKDLLLGNVHDTDFTFKGAAEMWNDFIEQDKFKDEQYDLVFVYKVKELCEV